MATYSNPWHRPHDTQYGPAMYSTDVAPVMHAGCAIYQRIKGCVWDVVKDGVCITQMAGLGGAKRAAEGGAK